MVLESENAALAVPAYGRQYITEAQVICDWYAGKDFRLVRGSYFSQRDANVLKELGFTKVTIVTLAAGRVEITL